MLKITFHPDSDQEDYASIIEDYQKLWKKEGKRIVETIQKFSGLKFKESQINAIVYKGSLSARSRPLSLHANVPEDVRKGTLVHELCHRVLAGNKVRIKFDDYKNASLEIHKVLNLILFDIWEELYEKKFADDMVAWESKSRSGVYKKAWEYALSFSKKEREENFKKLI